MGRKLIALDSAVIELRGRLVFLLAGCDADSSSLPVLIKCDEMILTCKKSWRHGLFTWWVGLRLGRAVVDGLKGSCLWEKQCGHRASQPQLQTEPLRGFYNMPRPGLNCRDLSEMESPRSFSRPEGMRTTDVVMKVHADKRL